VDALHRDGDADVVGDPHARERSEGMNGMPMDTARMEPLDATRVAYIFVHHTETAGGRDISAAEINRIHRDERGFSGIGYHFVVHPNGMIELGRPVTKQGAHVYGMNDRSIGIALAGNMDLSPPTPAAVASLAGLVVYLMRHYPIPLENVVGHREVNALVDAGVAPTRTPKSCPGSRTQMRKIRAAIGALLLPPPQPFQASPPEQEVDLAA
jgi:N-acetylmuramoyl-L-alanine amidase